MQQYRAYIKSNVSKPKPKQRCLLDLAKFIDQWKANHVDSSIILMMDSNGDGSDKHLQTFIQDTSLKDVVEYYSPELKEQNTYINGQKRLDYMFVSEDLLGPSNTAGHTEFFTHLFQTTEGYIGMLQ